MLEGRGGPRLSLTEGDFPGALVPEHKDAGVFSIGLASLFMDHADADGEPAPCLADGRGSEEKPLQVCWEHWECESGAG